MMRRTATCAGLALALYFSSWLPLDSKPREVVQALSMEGIDVVVLQGTPGEVTFTNGAPKARYNPSQLPRLLERRKGRVLVVYPEAGQRGTYEIELPRTIRRLDFTGASITVERNVGMSQLEVRTRGAVFWSGDIARLDIIDANTGGRDGKCRDCERILDIRKGRIEDLHISTRFGAVTLEDPDDIGRATLVLGPDARYSLGMGRKLASLRLLPWRAGIIDAPPQEAAPP